MALTTHARIVRGAYEWREGWELKEFTFKNIIMELHELAPEVLNFLVTMALPQAKKCEEKNIPLLCDTYGILMNITWLVAVSLKR